VRIGGMANRICRYMRSAVLSLGASSRLRGSELNRCTNPGFFNRCTNPGFFGNSMKREGGMPPLRGLPLVARKGLQSVGKQHLDPLMRDLDHDPHPEGRVIDHVIKLK